jgi:hypothetical protein
VLPHPLQIAGDIADPHIHLDAGDFHGMVPIR